MKELSIEEKSRRYDNIIEKANKMHSENCEACQACIEELIPELKESEDERIRKELIEFVKSRGGFKQEYIDWLEKQGEQKPADKVEPKFKVGDKVLIDGKVCTIKLVNDDKILKKYNLKDLILFFLVFLSISVLSDHAEHQEDQPPRYTTPTEIYFFKPKKGIFSCKSL